jgi:transglutaminase-like putative cysteine protease
MSPMRDGRGRVLALEALLAVAVLCAATPLSLLIAQGRWLGLLTLAVLVVCGLGAVLRVFRLRPLAVVGVQAVGAVVMVLFAEWSIRPTTGATPAATGPLRTQVQLLTTGVGDLVQGRAPVLLTPPSAVVVLLLITLVVLALDILCVDGGWTAVTAAVLAGFLLVPALIQPTGGPWYTVAGPVLGALLVLAAPTLLAGAWRRALTALGASVLVAGATPLVAGALPAIDRPPLPVDMDRINAWQGRESTGYSAQMIDDTISVRRGLMRGEETEMLSYTSDATTPGYLRLSTLTVFDGEQFVGPDRAGTPGDLSMSAYSDRRLARQRPHDAAHYDIRLSSLVGARLPAPADVRWADTGDLALSDAGRSGGELVPATGTGSLDGVSYQVAAVPEQQDEHDLRAVDKDDVQAPYREGYIDARGDARVRRLAQEVADDADAHTPFTTALAYQEWFHSEFDYSLSVRSDPGENALDAFLTEKVGYCEQFAATFALMMNAQGYPTRVAIGFTSGDEDGDGTWHVTNHNAHAWPEVWFGPQYGWVRFEPTPSSAGSGTADPVFETGSEDQDSEQEDQDEDTGQSTDAPDQDDSTTSAQAESQEAEDPDTSEAGGDTTSPTAARGRGGPGVVGWIVLGSVAGAAVLAGLGRLALRRYRTVMRERRWAGVGADGAGAAELAWDELTRYQPFRPDPARAPGPALADVLERARAAGLPVQDEHREAAARIAAALSAARYAPQGSDARPEDLRGGADLLLILLRPRGRHRSAGSAPRPGSGVPPGSS